MVTRLLASIIMFLNLGHDGKVWNTLEAWLVTGEANINIHGFLDDSYFTLYTLYLYHILCHICMIYSTYFRHYIICMYEIVWMHIIFLWWRWVFHYQCENRLAALLQGACGWPTCICALMPVIWFPFSLSYSCRPSPFAHIFALWTACSTHHEVRIPGKLIQQWLEDLSVVSVYSLDHKKLECAKKLQIAVAYMGCVTVGNGFQNISKNPLHLTMSIKCKQCSASPLLTLS